MNDEQALEIARREIREAADKVRELRKKLERAIQAGDEELQLRIRGELDIATEELSRAHKRAGELENSIASKSRSSGMVR